MQVIQLINHRERRGAEQFAARLAEELARHCKPENPFTVQLVALAEGRGELTVDTCLLPGRSLSLPRCLQAAARLASRLSMAPSGQALILQANAGRTLWVAVFTSWLLRLHSLSAVVVYRQASLASPWLRGRRAVTYIQEFFLNRCQAIASIAQVCADDLRAMHPQLRQPVVVIPNIVPVTSASIKPWHERQLVILMVGAFSPEKNHGLAFQAVGPLLASNLALRFVILGDGPNRSHWQAVVASESWASQVAFMGNVSTDMVAAHMNNARALLLCSHIEGQPGVIVEAMGSGLPVVATKVGGVPELLQENRGVLVPQDNAVALRDALEKVLKGQLPDLAAAREYATQTFAPAVVTSQFAELYRKLVAC